MTDNMSAIQRYFVNKATEKARIKNVKINGERATVVFSEYQAPENDVEEFRKQDGTDGHFFYITFYIWHKHVKSYWTDKKISTAYYYMTDKTEGNEIYKTIKATNSYDFKIN
jgi:hypothetical protein